MAYKDKAKQREVHKDIQRRYRERQKGITVGVTDEGVTDAGVTKGVTNSSDGEELAVRGLRWRDVTKDEVRRPWFEDGVGWTIRVMPRYLHLSDGQVLDRAEVVSPKVTVETASVISRANRAGAQRCDGVSPNLIKTLKKVVTKP